MNLKTARENYHTIRRYDWAPHTYIILHSNRWFTPSGVQYIFNDEDEKHDWETHPMYKYHNGQSFTANVRDNTRNVETEFKIDNQAAKIPAWATGQFKSSAWNNFGPLFPVGEAQILIRDKIKKHVRVATWVSKIKMLEYVEPFGASLFLEHQFYQWAYIPE